MADLLVIVPTRGRPASAARLVQAVRDTAAAGTHIAFAADDDDPWLGGYRDTLTPLLGHGDQFITGPRDGLAGWTNRLALANAHRYRYLASFGDDHVPVTPGWDLLLTAAIGAMPGGIGYSYAAGGRRDCPEGVVMSSAIVTALGWMALPRLRHFCIDNVWSYMGRRCQCIRYLPDVRIDHLHHTAGLSELDATYSDAIAKGDRDIWEYRSWWRDDANDDLRKLRALIARQA